MVNCRLQIFFLLLAINLTMKSRIVSMDLGGVAAFEYHEPAQLRVPFLFNSPHSGRVYPRQFLQQSVLDATAIRMSEDCYVDLLICDVVRLGAGFMAANFPRALVDVNREAYELDPEMFDEALPEFVPEPSMRVSAGLGTIPKVVAANMNIYDGTISLSDALNRIDRFYIPYHKQLDHALSAMRDSFGFAILIDCHSMPGKLKFFGGVNQPDFILGDQHGRSCSQSFSLYAADLLREKGYTVSLNRPYSGGFITAHYGKPVENFHSLQIEINRSLYLNEISLEMNSNFLNLHKDLMDFAADLMAFPESELIGYQMAAE